MRVLVIAPHPDDEVLGCGGTIVKHSSAGDEVYLCVVTKVYSPDWAAGEIEDRRGETLKANEILGIKQTCFLGFPTVKLDTIPQKRLNDALTQVISKIQPEVVYIPYWGDANRDHQLVAGATVIATRPKPGWAVPVRSILKPTRLTSRVATTFTRSQRRD